MTNDLQFTGWLLFILISYFHDTRNLVIWWLKIRGVSNRHVAKCWFWIFVNPFFGAPSFFSHTHLLNWLGYLCTLVWPFPSVALLNWFGTCLICSSLLVSFLNLFRSYVQKKPQLCSGFVKIIEDFLLTTFEMSCFRRKDMLFEINPHSYALFGGFPTTSTTVLQATTERPPPGCLSPDWTMFLQDCDAFVVVREPMERMLSEFNWLKTFGVDETLRPKIVESASVCWSLVDVMNF